VNPYPDHVPLAALAEEAASRGKHLVVLKRGGRVIVPGPEKNRLVRDGLAAALVYCHRGRLYTLREEDWRDGELPL
jgi:hypothetical protein